MFESYDVTDRYTQHTPLFAKGLKKVVILTSIYDQIATKASQES